MILEFKRKLAVGGDRGKFTLCWFSLNNSEMVKGRTLVFCRDICVTFGIPNLSQRSDIWQNSDGGISDFLVSGYSLIKVNCRNSRTSYDIEIKLRPNLTKETKQDRKNLTMMLCRQIVTSLSFFRFMVNLEQSGSRFLNA